LKQLDEELASLDDQIAKLDQLRSSIATERNTLIALYRSRQTAISDQNVVTSQPKKPQNAIDFTKSNYEWSSEAKDLARDIWRVKSWRHCQEAAINASMAGRDAVVVMPTGKSKFFSFEVFA